MKRPYAVMLMTGAVTALLLGSEALAASGPTCSDVLDIRVHGQHIVGDYVTGLGHKNLTWPPAQQVGAIVMGVGAAVPGAPGPGFHFTAGFAPGASFCNSQSQSPGFHANR